MLRHRRGQLWSMSTLLMILLWLAFELKSTNRQRTRTVLAQPTRDEQPTFPDHDLRNTLCHYGVCGITNEALVTYARVDFEEVEVATLNPPLVQNISIVFPMLEPLELNDALSRQQLSRQAVIVQSFPNAYAADASNILFGLSTTLVRLEASLAQMTHWASNHAIRIIALVPEDFPPHTLNRTSAKARRLGIDLTIVTSDMPHDDRYFHLGSLLNDNLSPATDWVSFIDDDTFFLSMGNVQAMLSRYAAPQTQSYYVGSFSEDLSQIYEWGMIAYGGGGIFLSTALLKQLHPHLAECARLTHTGDARLAQCIYTCTTTKLSPEPRLHQLDLWGDVSGFYEAVRPQPLSVHHWKSWHHVDPVNLSKVSTVCGDACILQKFRFANGWKLTNGYSIVRYSDPVNDDEHTMEKTFQDSTGGDADAVFSHSLAPLRARDPAKIQFLLEGATLEGDGGAAPVLRQFYVRRTQGGRDVQIVEVEWRRKTDRGVITAFEKLRSWFGSSSI